MSTPYPLIQFLKADSVTGDAALRPFDHAVFSLTGTTTVHPVYRDAGKTMAFDTPMDADDVGVFPEFFLDESVQYRLRIYHDGGDLADPDYDLDPINELPFDLTSGEVIDALGYTPVDPANAVFTAEARITFTDEPTILHTDSIGYRGTPAIITDAGYTLKLSDAGKSIDHDDTSAPAVVIPANSDVPFPLGTMIYFQNTNTGVMTFTRDVPVDLRIAGDGTNKDVAVAEWGMGYIRKYDTDSWLVNGVGVS